IGIKIFSYELHTNVPIASVGTVVLGRRWDADDLLDHLHNVVTANSIDILLPFVDGAVAAAGSYEANFSDVWAPVVDPGLAETMFDKTAAAIAFKNAHLPIPATYTWGRPEFPLIAKPRHGSASKGIFIIDTIAELRRVLKEKDSFLIQRYYPRREEFTVDCYISRRGKILCVSPRRRLEVLGGEVVRTITVDSPELIALSTEIINALKLKGAVTIQFLRDQETDQLLLMEINPRLGGGVVCSIHAGGDIPSLIIREAVGMPLEPIERVRPYIEITRYFEEVAFNVVTE
ncbi:MAG: ATP-grasp domain-containing protein, partial [Duncaniella sp.]|nr:ATP-grasp domain-containing protein [Duncaniella sp.]